MPAVGIGHVGPERGHLDPERPRSQHLHDPEAQADRDAAAEKAADLLWPSVSGHVVILGRQAKQLIAHAAPRPQGLVARLVERAHDLDGKLTLGHGCVAMVSFTQNNSRFRP